MIGKLVELHPDDAFYCDGEFLIGTLWEISEMYDAGKLSNTAYLSGMATYVGTSALEYVSNYFHDGHVPMRFVVGGNELAVFHAAKFEILENDEVK